MKPRPMFLNLFAIRFPVTAYASILHRLSGVFLALFIPILLGWLQWSLTSAALAEWDPNFLSQKIKIMIWLLLSAFFYHLLAGIRHMIMDVGWGESWTVSKLSAQLVIIVIIIVSVGIGYWLWV